MALLDTARTTQHAHAAPGFLSRLVTAALSWNDRRATRNALSRLSDRELEDIGLCRGDIDTVIARL